MEGQGSKTEFRNFTPFPALAFEAIDQNEAPYHVVVLRQTIRIERDGHLRYEGRQSSLCVADEYFGAMNASSIKQESDLAPYKPKCDVIAIANAHSPGGRPARSFPVSVRVSRPGSPPAAILEKRLVVTGPRFWHKADRFSGWSLTEPGPVTVLPVRYEYSYGGELRLGDAQGPSRHAVVETNPVGRGYWEDWFVKTNGLSALPAPQVEDPANPVQRCGVHYAAQGFGAIARSWLPRRNLSGTADDAFARSSRWLPHDFDFAYWNCAHPDLQTTHLQGDEIVDLTNLTPDGKLTLQLPGHVPYVMVRYVNGQVAPATLALDTVIIDAVDMRLSLVNRLLLSKEPEVRVLEARLITRDQWRAALPHTGGPKSPISEAALG